MILVQNENHLYLDINQEMLEAAILLALSEFNQADVDLTLRLTDDTEMTSLNRAYRGLAETTDVLSFNQDIVDPETGCYYLGDIIISLEKAQSQALDHGHSLSEECTLLAIHGTLHLLGFDHDTPERTAEMWKMQEKLFDQVTSKFLER
jgi:probable rRNA maturation factor